MSVDFSHNPIFSGPFAHPFRAEVDVYDCEVEGELPGDLDGAFYRVQPDFIYPPTYANDVPFNGDGNVSMFRFANGHVDFKCRYVRTQRYKAQTQARRALYGTYRNRATDDPGVRHRSGGTANTNLIFHAGRLFALKEDSPPVLMDPNTLETLDDYYTFGGKLRSETFSAHPKIDYATGEMFNICYEAKGNGSTDVCIIGIDKTGEINWEAWIKVPYAGLLHDFALSENYIAFLVIPMAVNMEQMQKGGVHFAWDSTLPTWFGVLRRGGDGSDLRYFKGPERSATHVMNSFCDGDRIYADMDMSQGNQFPFFPMLHEKFDFKRAAGRLTRVSVDLSKSAETYDMEVLYPEIGVLPRTDERYWGHPYNVGFMPVTDLSKRLDDTLTGNTGLVLNTWTRFDHNTHKSTSYYVGNTSSLQECQFIPRSQTAAEGSGYLVGLANRHVEQRSDLLVLDAEHLDEGPIATVKLPIKLRNGVHGHYVPGNLLPHR